MNRDDIIRMAHETDCLDDQHYGTVWANKLERFAALVAAAVAPVCGECGKSSAEGWALYCVQCSEDSMVKAAVAEEREACARVCDEADNPWSLAATIRARGEK